MMLVLDIKIGFLEFYYFGFFLFFEQKSYALDHLNVSASENQFFVCGFDAYLGKFGSS